MQPLGLDLIPRNQTVAIAVSGGGDSLCLLHLCHNWAQSTGNTMLALTVDHGLRAESTDEAKLVAALCDELSIRHRTLNWDHPSPSQAAARQARHRLLAQAARQANARWLLLGHTLDDVAETVAMRAARDVALEKQAGPMPVSVSPVWPEGQGLMIVRPLILERRQTIREWLEHRNLTWIDDPSNENPAYERPRQRAHLKSDPETAIEKAHLALSQRLDRATSITTHLNAIAESIDPFGLVTMPVLSNQNLLDALITLIIPAAAGHDRPPRAIDRKSLITSLDAASSGQRFTLGGAWIERKTDHILIGREPGKNPPGLKGALWDGRFEKTETPKLPEKTPHFLVRHAVPPNQYWQCLIQDRLKAAADAMDMNVALLTKHRATTLS